MGLVRAASAAVGGVMADQWREYFYCDVMPNDVLVMRGRRRVGAGSSNTKGSDDVISNGSIIAVNEGQYMLMVERGQVFERADSAGEYEVTNSSEASLLYGDVRENLGKVVALAAERFSFGGDVPKTQRVYYFNALEIMGNDYEVQGSVPFRTVDDNVGLDIDIAVRCEGSYSYRIADPEVFYKRVCGNVVASYHKSRLARQLDSEVLTALQPALGYLSAEGLRLSELPAHTMELCTALKDILTEQWMERRGIEVVSFTMDSLYAQQSDARAIRDTQLVGALRDRSMVDALLASARSDALRIAAGNTGRSNMFVGAIRGQAPTPAPAPTTTAWFCPDCGARNEGNFCHNCGHSRP